MHNTPSSSHLQLCCQQTKPAAGRQDIHLHRGACGWQATMQPPHRLLSYTATSKRQHTPELVSLNTHHDDTLGTLNACNLQAGCHQLYLLLLLTPQAHEQGTLSADALEDVRACLGQYLETWLGSSARTPGAAASTPAAALARLSMVAAVASAAHS